MNNLEVCARRMERLLNSKPRHPKTIAYVKTLPGRKRPAKVTADDFILARSAAIRVIEAAIEVAAAVVAEPARAKRRRRDYGSRTASLPPLVRVQNGICASCGDPMHSDKFREDREMRATVDHVIPRAIGGSDAIGNFVAMHSACNNAKGARPPNGCERIWLLAVNIRLGAYPQR